MSKLNIVECEAFGPYTHFLRVTGVQNADLTLKGNRSAATMSMFNLSNSQVGKATISGNETAGNELLTVNSSSIAELEAIGNRAGMKDVWAQLLEMKKAGEPEETAISKVVSGLQAGANIATIVSALKELWLRLP